MKPVQTLIKHFGNISDTAHILRSVAVELYGDKAAKFDRQMVQNWVVRGFIPFRHGELVEKVTNGAITKEQVWESASKH